MENDDILATGIGRYDCRAVFNNSPPIIAAKASISARSDMEGLHLRPAGEGLPATAGFPYRPPRERAPLAAKSTSAEVALPVDLQWNLQSASRK